jgi:hypothetical protein
MAILRHSKIAITMEVYTQGPDKATRDALRKLSDFLGGSWDDAAEVEATASATGTEQVTEGRADPPQTAA